MAQVDVFTNKNVSFVPADDFIKSYDAELQSKTWESEKGIRSNISDNALAFEALLIEGEKRGGNREARATWQVLLSLTKGFAPDKWVNIGEPQAGAMLKKEDGAADDSKRKRWQRAFVRDVESFMLATGKIICERQKGELTKKKAKAALYRSRLAQMVVDVVKLAKNLRYDPKHKKHTRRERFNYAASFVWDALPALSDEQKQVLVQRLSKEKPIVTDEKLSANEMTAGVRAISRTERGFADTLKAYKDKDDSSIIHAVARLLEQHGEDLAKMLQAEGKSEEMILQCLETAKDSFLSGAAKGFGVSDEETETVETLSTYTYKQTNPDNILDEEIDYFADDFSDKSVRSKTANPIKNQQVNFSSGQNFADVSEAFSRNEPAISLMLSELNKTNPASILVIECLKEEKRKELLKEFSEDEAGELANMIALLARLDKWNEENKTRSRRGLHECATIQNQTYEQTQTDFETEYKKHREAIKQLMGTLTDDEASEIQVLADELAANLCEYNTTLSFSDAVSMARKQILLERVKQ